MVLRTQFLQPGLPFNTLFQKKAYSDMAYEVIANCPRQSY